MDELHGHRANEHRVRHDWNSDRPLEMTIFDAVSEAVGERAVSGLPSLYDRVDPDALERLFAPTDRSRREQGSVAFRFAGCRITLTATGEITLVPCVEERDR